VGYALRGAGCGFVPIVLVVVLVLVIEIAEHVRKIRWGVEDEDKDEDEFPASCAEKDLEFSQWQMVVGAASSRD
jgi:Na+-transporting methylmalonyl-CoA/oxaloacetate decarboxylase gamma subunit